MDATHGTLLLIDDEEANLDLLGAVLRPRGFTSLVQVSDPRLAAAAFQASRPDLVLLDLHMPHRSGFEVLDELRALIPADDFVPILVLTADVTPAVRERALGEGAHDFVTKPFDRTEVLLRVRNLLRTRLLHVEQRRARDAAERAAARDRLLAEASHLLGTSFDTTTSLAQLARLLASGWADACTVDLWAEGTMLRVASSPPADGPDPASAPPEPGFGLLAPEALRAALGPGAWESGLRVPLPGSAGVVGWLTLARTARRVAFDAAELALASELGRRAALGVENARAFQAAHQAIAAREQVLTVVAHDLRSPLTAVRLEVEMLRLEPARPLAEEHNRVLQRVERTVGRMDGLIQDLLDVARIGQGALALDRRPCDPGALLLEAAATLRPLVESQALTFDVRGPATLPEIDVDAGRLLQAVSNLVGNAAKFARFDGRVGLAWELANGELRIEVSDDGPGIPPDQLQHIFGAFWQARHADRRGLGLGLSIVQAITDAHGGRVWVESESGQATTFFLAIPTPIPAE